MRRIHMLVFLIALTGCATATADAPGPTFATSGELREGVLAADAGLEGGCVWLDTGGERLEVLWPEGYRATGDPIELRDPTGAVVATAGDRVRVRGSAAGDAVSTCQVGPTWRAEDVQPVR